MRQVIIDGVEYIPKKQIKSLLADAKVGDLCQTRGEGYHLISDVYTDQHKYAYERNCGDTIYVRENGMFNLTNHEHPFDIIHTEPLAPEGTAEWAWQMAKLGIETKCSRGKIRISKSGMIEVCYNGMAYAMPMTQSPENRQYVINKMRECSPDGWQLYEPEPEPKFAVGDWVEFRDIEGIKHGIIEGRREEYSVLCNGVSQSVGDKFITRKLNPSEIVLDFGNGIRGTIRRSRGEQIRIYDGDINIACLAISYVTEPMQTTVRKLLAAIEEERKKQ
jgi:hypothetical protein